MPVTETVNQESRVQELPVPGPEAAELPITPDSQRGGSPDPQPVGAPTTERIYRHRLPVRLGHWLNALCLFILIMSGLQIFNAHPALYWGERSDRDRAFLSIQGVRSESGELRGVTSLGASAFDTTGVLGVSGGERRAFPSWATLPGSRWLAMGRQWHLLFAWVFVINGLLFWLYLDRQPPFGEGLASDRAGLAWNRAGSRQSSPIPPSIRRGGQAVQRLAETGLHRRGLRPRAAHRADGADHVADRRRRLSLPAGSLRRSAVGALHPFSGLRGLRGIHRRASDDGGHHRAAQ